MGFLKSIFGKNKPSEEVSGTSPVPKNFNQLTKKAIELIGRDSLEMENDQLVDYLVSNGIPEHEAIELYLFLPTAFTRKLLPDVKWIPYYVDYYSETNKIKRNYQDNLRYKIIEQETNLYWNNKPNNEYILNIAGRSSEFHAINKLLNDGGKLENARLVEATIVR